MLSEKLRVRRMKLAGHLIRHPEEAAHETVLNPSMVTLKEEHLP